MSSEHVHSNKSIRMCEDPHRTFEIFTYPNGLTNGRSYMLRTSDADGRGEWVEKIRWAVKNETKRILAQSHKTQFYKIQRVMQEVCASPPMQYIPALLVVGNFMLNVIQFEILPQKGSKVQEIFDKTDIVFTSLFCIELSMNMIAQCWKTFWSSYWNWLDFVVVFISLLSLVTENMPGISFLRLLRVFRVLRLFKKLQSVRTIVESLSAAILPVINAMFVLILVSSLYAVVSVMRFGDTHKDQFGRFSLALFTMFQISTGDAWASEIVRPMKTGGPHDIWISVFFTSYFVITGVVMMNVVVAVLLDEFVNTVTSIKESSKEAVHTVREDILDPLLKRLAHFNTSADLSSKIQTIYEMLDSDSSGQLTFEEFEEGLKKLTHDFEEQDQILSLTSDEFNILTTRPDGGTYLSDEGALPAEAWEAMIRAQLAIYVQRQLAFGSLWEAASTADTNTCSCMQAVLHALQLLMLKTEFTPQTAAMCAQIHDRTNPESIFTPIASKRPYSQPLAKNAAATAAEDVPLNISASFRATDERIERIENIISAMSDKVDKALCYLEGENVKNGGDDHTGFADRTWQSRFKVTASAPHPQNR